ncbi:MAG: flavin reductase family protein, partial [Clostridia bacterium]|nr:flavin reductase family protein [Clostridia bacterium]
MARKSFKAGALTAPLPPVMVTVGDMENSNIITIGWTGILSTIPPRTYISVRPERYSYKLLKQTGEFVINLTTANQAKVVDYVGIYTGAKVDKFKECRLTKTASKEVSAPTIAECPLALECRVVEVIPMGTHDVFIADIVSVSCDDGILDEAGKIRFDKAGLLAYAHGEYYALGEKVGRFGFSTDKPKKSTPKPKSAQEKTGNKNGTAQKSESREENKKRPFYLDAPRGKGKG